MSTHDIYTDLLLCTKAHNKINFEILQVMESVKGGLIDMIVYTGGG